MDVAWDVGTLYLGISRHATLADATQEAVWNLRSRGKRRYPLIYERIKALTAPNQNSGADIALWEHDHDDFKPTFLATKTWDSMRAKRRE